MIFQHISITMSDDHYNPSVGSKTKQKYIQQTLKYFIKSRVRLTGMGQ